MPAWLRALWRNRQDYTRKSTDVTVIGEGQTLRHSTTCAGLLPLPHVQFWETENGGRLDRSHRGGHHRDIPCLVDASGVRTVNVLKAASGVVTECDGDVTPTARWTLPSLRLSLTCQFIPPNIAAIA
jgi:hypothetical protein